MNEKIQLISWDLRSWGFEVGVRDVKPDRVQGVWSPNLSSSYFFFPNPNFPFLFLFQTPSFPFYWIEGNCDSRILHQKSKQCRNNYKRITKTRKPMDLVEKVRTSKMSFTHWRQQKPGCRKKWVKSLAMLRG